MVQSVEGGGNNAALTPAQLKAKVATATAQAKANANPRSLSTLKAIQNALTAQGQSLDATGTTLAAQNAAMSAAAANVTALKAQSSKDAKDAEIAAAIANATVAATPKIEPKIIDPNANKPGWHLDATSGKWVVDVVDDDGDSELIQDGLGNGQVDTSATTLLEGPTDAQLAREDAFKALESLFAQYGLESLAGKIGQYMREGKGPNEATILIKKSDEYKTRFSGNETRAKLGLNVISEAEYIDLENSYAKTLRAYGLSNMMSLDRASNEKKFATYIGADMAADEFADRVGTVSERVMRADPSIKKQFKDFFPSIQDSDLVAYFLSPTEMLPVLKEKVAATEIGAAASSQGLQTSLESATGLAKFGVDRVTALKGYSTISDILPTTSKLGDIYKESKNEYTQKTAEEEVFKGAASAARKRKNLAELEAGSFGGSSGTGKTSFGTSISI